MALSDNKKAGFNYEIADKFEAGVELLGLEVKSVKAGRAILEGSYVRIRGGEAFLVGALIPSYQPNNTPASYDSERVRRLLLTKKEISELAGLESQKGLTLVPLSLYNKGRVIKLSFALAKHKKKYDKRETLKKKDLKREIERSLKNVI